MTDNNLLAFITTKIIKFLSQNYDYYLKAPNISRKLITFHIKNKAKQSSIAIQSTFSPPFRHEFPHPIHPSSTQSLPAPTFKQKYPPPHTAPNSPGTPFRPTQQIASIHPARSIVPRSMQHRLTLHVASPHTPRSIGSCSTERKSSLFQVHVSPSSRRPLAPLQSLPSRMLRCHRNLPALFVHFPPVVRSFLNLPAPSACFPPCFLSFPIRSSFLPVLYVAIPSQPARAFLPPAFRSAPSLPPPVPCLALPQYRKSPPGLLSEGF